MKIKNSIFIFVLYSLPVLACDVPVFRYALERWAPDAYEISVLYDQDLSDEQITLLEPLLEKDAAKPGGYNYVIQWVDLRENSDAPVLRFLDQKPSTLPLLVLRYPPNAKRPYAIWSGPLSMESIQVLLTSPIRTEISEALLNNTSAVWVFLNSGNKERDDEVFALFENEVMRLQRELKLPLLDENAERETIYLDEALKAQLGISFSIVRLSRDNPEEQALIAMMLGSEIDLPLYAHEPMAFPIFGQGRLLYALIGDGVNRETLQDAGQFLVGPCSCQIKDDNPGIDLMMPIVWADHIETEMVRDRPLPAPIPALGGINATGELVAMQPIEQYKNTSVDPVLINSFYAVGVLLIISLAASVILALRSRE
ncbi:MAG: hypothetical protein P9L94_11095 [Candidatus Hinthialibacter antarcticus]|nr:hypothetical protein [Candidatus Hinthialibacter antarcticus]